MAKSLRAGADPVQANKVAGQSPAQASLSPDVVREVYGLVSRVIRATNVDAVAGECGVDRSTIWKWAKHPERVYAGALEILAEYDPDPDGISRIAACLMAGVAARAIARKAAAALPPVFDHVNGKWIR